MKYSYRFPAIRGTQATRDFYSFMCPLGIVHKLFVFDDVDIPDEFRAQRVLNKKRIPEISNYMLDNPTDYVFSSLTASIDGTITFEPASNESTLKDVGVISIDMESKLIINDGQHRRAAIEEAIKINPKLKDESISVVLFIDEALQRCQQMFSDLNQHAVNISNSIGILYDHRDPLALHTKEIVSTNANLKTYVDMSNSTLAHKSNKLFLLSNFHEANMKLLKGLDFNSEDVRQFSREYWAYLAHHFNEWLIVFRQEVTPFHSRQSSISSYGVVLEALGVLGNHLYVKHPRSWQNKLEKLNQINWSRTNSSDWQHRCIGPTGKIVKNQSAIKLTVNKIKQYIDVPLTEQENRLEIAFREEIING